MLLSFFLVYILLTILNATVMENDVKQILTILGLNPEKISNEQLNMIDKLLDNIYRDGFTRGKNLTKNNEY